MKMLKKISVLLLAAALLCSFLALPGAAAATKNAVLTMELEGERNVEGDPAPKEVGWAGTAVTIGDKDIVITAVGRMFFTGANITHSFLVVNAEDGSLVNTNAIAVQNYDDSVDGTFEYYYFEEYEYLTLYAGKTYYFCSDFYGPLDRHYDSCKVTSPDDISFVGTVDLNLADGSWIYTDAPGINNLPIDFMYYVVGEEDTEPDPTAAPTEPKEDPKDDPDEKPADPTQPTQNSDAAPANMGLWIGIGVAAVVVIAVVIAVVLKKKKH
ncbi:MAG: hypothetical protein E7436_01795 [Ruminococcaceae bacterium]|nr:hypothetical protein [Oscillospiraceae bacterium]